MLYLAIKSALSGILIMAISEVARRSPALGGLIASLPLVSILGILWLWKDTADTQRVADHAYATFWFVLPTLPMFLIFPLLLKAGVSFWIALGLSCLATVGLYLLTLWLLPKVGVHI